MTVLNRRDQFKEWCDWYISNFPSTDPMELVRLHGKDVDLRVFFLAHNKAGYSILLFLEACYAVDKAICGLDKEAFALINKRHMPEDMTVFGYLLSEDMANWWELEFCELSNKIRQPSSNRVSVKSRLRVLGQASAKMMEVIDPGLINSTCQHPNFESRLLSAEGDDMILVLPAGLWQGTIGRHQLLKESVGIMYRELGQYELQESRVPSIVTISPKRHDTEGLRRRIPRSSALEDSRTPQQTSSNIASIDGQRATDQASLFELPSHQSHHSPQKDSKHPWYSDLLSSQVLEWPLFAKVITICRRFSAFLVHMETSLVVFSCLVATSAVFMAISTRLNSILTSNTCQLNLQLTSDPNFSSNISQAILSILSVYLIILPIARSKSLGLRYRFWFWACLSISCVTSILSLGLYSMFPVASVVLGWIGTFAQAAITLLLAQSIDKVSKAGSLDSLELH